MSLQHPLKKFYFKRVDNYTVKIKDQTKSGNLPYCKISFCLKFGYPVIIQSFKLTKKDTERNPFNFESIEGNLLGDLIDYEKFLGTKKTQKKIKKVNDEHMKEIVYFKTSGVGEVVRMNFYVEDEYYTKYMNFNETLVESVNFVEDNLEDNQDMLENRFRRDCKERFLDIFEGISFFGISSAKSIKPYVGLNLINLALEFRKEGMFLSANEVELATALALGNEKKNNQSLEILKKCVSFLDYCADGIIEHLIKLKNHEFSFNSVQKILKQIADIRFRCSLISILMASLSINEMKISSRVKNLEMALKFYKKSKKKGKCLNQDDEQDIFKINEEWYERLYSILPDVVKLLSEVIKAEEAKYYKIASMELFNYLLKTYGGSLGHMLIDIFKTILNFLKANCRNKLYNWERNSYFTKDEALSKIKSVTKENEKISKIFENGFFEVESNEDPYISTTPILFSNSLNFFDNLALLLPSLSAPLLHEIFEVLMESYSVGNLEIPLSIRLSLSKITEKILIICQADLNFAPESLQKIVTIQTLLNNRDYRTRVSSMVEESEEHQLTVKEVFSLHLEKISQNDLNIYTTYFSHLWEALKTKFLFLISFDKGVSFLISISNRLRLLLNDLNNQVLTEDFNRLNMDMKQNQQLSIGDLKFERFGNNSEDKARLNSGDVIKSKVEYLKNFRNIFGEFEYYLEIIDCLSANFIDKSQEIKFGNDAMKKKMTGEDGEREITEEAEIEKVDDTSKKLVRIYVSKEVENESLFERECWESVRIITDVLTDFLVVFMRDGVFIDYFASTWVILVNFANLLKEKKNEVLGHLVWSLLKNIEVGGENNYPTNHTIKCILKTFEILKKDNNLKNMKEIKNKMVGLMKLSFLQLSHNQSSDIFKLCKRLIELYEADMNYEDCKILMNSLKDPSLSFQNGDYQNLLNQFLKSIFRSKKKTMFSRTLKYLIKDEIDLKKKNLMKRQEILARRRKKSVNNASKKISEELKSQEKLRRLEILAYFVKLSSFEFISHFCDSPKENQDIFESEGDLSLFRFLENCLKEKNHEFQRGVLKALLCFILLERERDGSLEGRIITTEKLRMIQFSYKLMLKMASIEDLRPESKHDLMVLCLILFSKIFPPAHIENEVKTFEAVQKNKIEMLNTGKTLFKDVDWSVEGGQKRNKRFHEVKCFESLANYAQYKDIVDYSDINYTNVRVYEMFKMYAFIRYWLESPWSSIKGLVCNFISYLVPCTSAVLDEGLNELIRTEIGSLLQRLMSSKESEAIISGLNILGSFCGFGQESASNKKFDFKENILFFKRNSEIVPIEIWEKVYKLQKSWDLTIQIASIVIYQMALPRDYERYISKKSKESAVLNDLSNSIKSGKKEDQHTANKSKDGESFRKNSGVENEKKSEENQHKLDDFLSALNSKGFEKVGSSIKKSSVQSNFWLEESFTNNEIKQLLGIFKLNFVVEENVWIEQQFAENKIFVKIEETKSPHETDRDGDDLQAFKNSEELRNHFNSRDSNNEFEELDSEENRENNLLDSRNDVYDSLPKVYEEEKEPKKKEEKNTIDMKSNMFKDFIREKINSSSPSPDRKLKIDKLKIKKKSGDIQAKIEDKMTIFEKLKEKREKKNPRRSSDKENSKTSNKDDEKESQGSKRSSGSLNKRPLSLEAKEKIKKYTKELAESELKKKYSSRLAIRKKKKKKNSMLSTTSKPETVKSLNHLYNKSKTPAFGGKKDSKGSKKRSNIRDNYSSFRHKFYNKRKGSGNKRSTTSGKGNHGQKTKRKKSGRKEISSLLTSHFLKPSSNSKNLTEGSVINYRNNKSQANLISKSRKHSKEFVKKSLNYDKKKFFGKVTKGAKNSSTGNLKYKNIDYKSIKKNSTHFKSVRTSSSDKVLNNLKSKIYNKMSTEMIKKHVSKYTKGMGNATKYSKKSSSIQRIFSSKKL